MIHIIIGCGKTKRREYDLAMIDFDGSEARHGGPGFVWVPRSHPMVELYTGNLFKARLRFAQALGGPHWIISAFHGCRRPDYRSAWYERTLSRDNRRWFAATVRDTLLQHTKPRDTIIVLASGPYCADWADELHDAGRRVELPLSGMGLGQQLAYLKKACSLRQAC